MLQSSFGRPQKSDELTIAIAPGRDVFFPPFSGISVFYTNGPKY